MKFLIAGLGSIGRRHLQNLLALGEQDIILYRTHLGPGQATLPALASDPLTLTPNLADFPVETDLRSALARRPDAVIVSNPTALHLEVAIPAALAGCHLLLEKPISHSQAGIPELQAAVKHGGAQVLVGFQFRYHPGLIKIVETLSALAIGRPLSVRAHWGEYLPGWHPWEDYRKGYSARPDLGGGVVLTLSHPLDYLRLMFGEVNSLWAFTGKISDLELSVEDSAEIGLRFQNGMLGSLHLDYYQRPTAHRLEIIGTHGAIAWDNAGGVVSVTSIVEDNRAENLQFPPPPGFNRNELFLAQLRHFREVVSGNATPVCSLEDGVRALELALAVHRSQQTGQLIRFH